LNFEEIKFSVDYLRARMINECEAISEMRTGSRSGSTVEEQAQMSFCP
jgi:hypothetical protein